MSDRERILAAVRAALGSPGGPDPPAEPRPGSPAHPGELLARFEAEAKAVGAEVFRGRPEEIIASLGGTESLATTRPAWAIADSGTVVEYHSAGSDSTASALADVHVAVVVEDRILPDLAAFYRQFREDLAATAGPLYAVFITGPSRTADIEQTLVLGAHGPKRLVVVLAPPGAVTPPW